MTKTELLEKAKQIKSRAEELIEKTAALRTEAGNSLQAAKRRESALIAARKKEEEARLEREKAERWQEYLN